MSDLSILHNLMESPPAACMTAPDPEAAQDECHLTLPLQDKGKPDGRVYNIRFKRVGDQFVLSENEFGHNHWYERHANRNEIAKIVRVSGTLFQSNVAIGASAAKVVTAMAQFIVTGEIHVSDRTTNKHDWARVLLNVFTDSGTSLPALLGQLQILRTSPIVAQDDKMLERIKWTSGILDHVAKYRDFRQHLIQDSDIALLTSGPSDKKELVKKIAVLAREVITTHATHRPIQYDKKTTEAYRAYQELYGDRVRKKGDKARPGDLPDFCTALAQAINELSGRRGFGGSYVQTCREITPLIDLPPLEAAVESIALEFEGKPGRSILQRVIEAESEAANMSIEWFSPENENGERGEPRPSFRAVADSFLNHVSVDMEADSLADTKIHFDLPSFQQELELNIETNSTTRREYIILGLAILRRYFGNEGTPPRQKIFTGGNFHEMSWENTSEELRAIRRYMGRLEARLKTSHDTSDVYLPVAEAITCGVGVAGLVVAETVKPIKEDETLQLIVGTSGAGLAGGGCSSLLMHFAGRPIIKYKNRYLWEGVTFGVGAAGGVAAYLGFKLPLGDDPQPIIPPPEGGTKFPVDKYGP